MVVIVLFFQLLCLLEPFVIKLEGKWKEKNSSNIADGNLSS